MDGCSPAVIREILEGYCLDCETVTEGEITLTSDSPIATLAEDQRLLSQTRVDAEGLPEGTRIIVKAGTELTLSVMATETGTFPATFRQYKNLSDNWLVNTRDYQIIPVVRRFTGLSFDGVKRITEYHSGTGSTILFVDHRPIRKVHAINLITNPENWVYVSPSSIEPIPEEGILKLKAVLESWQNYVPAFPRGTDNIKIDYEYGYDEIPPEVCRAVAMLTAAQALVMIGSRSGGGSLSVQGYTKNYGQRGKYTDYINELERWGDGILRNYVMGMSGQ
jgi:hypothetical protein